MSENGVNQVNGAEKGQTVAAPAQSNALGICSIACSIVSIFLAALVFAPLGVRLGLVAAFKKQVALGVIGIIIGVISLLLSPSFQLLLVGMGLRMGMR